MCGIAGGLGEPRPEALEALAHRGPDAANVVKVGAFWLAHTRLAIRGLGAAGDQPFVSGPVTIAYNGELWNDEELRATFPEREWKTTADTETVAAVLERDGEDGLAALEGMFALLWYDERDGLLRAARDRFGEVPLHQDHGAFGSELRALAAAGGQARRAKWVLPGTVVRMSERGERAYRQWYAPRPRAGSEKGTLATAAGELRDLIGLGVRERSVSDVPVAVLVSGGIDSTSILAELREHVPDLVGYTAVYDPRSRDLRCAREACEMFEVPLVEVPVSAPTADDLASVVRAIELPFKAQVEIGWACLALARRLREDGKRVVFSGEGADELLGSYSFAYHAIRKDGWTQARRDLFVGQHRKNFARANKVFMAHSVECRLPFLHTSLVERVLGFSEVEARGEVGAGTSRAKEVIQAAYRGRVPRSITDRPKVAFQDGAGLKEAAARAVASPRTFYTAEHHAYLRGLDRARNHPSSRQARA